MNYPTIKQQSAELPADPDERLEAFIDIFGQHSFSTRNQVIDLIRDLLLHSEPAQTMDKQRRELFYAAKNLDEKSRRLIEEICRVGIDLFLQHMLGLFMNTGTGLRLDDTHCIRYRVVMEIVDHSDEDEKIMDERVINRDGQKAFSDYYGRWLLRHRDHR